MLVYYLPALTHRKPQSYRKEFMELIINQSDPYAEKIKTFVYSQFTTTCCKEKEILLDLVSKEILGSGQSRYGPLPNPESVVEIRRVISHWIEQERPIPILIPWGSEKPNGTAIDVAELCAFRTLECLNNRVKQFYPPGMVINIKMEDVSAPHLFYDRMEQARKDAALYVGGFTTLVDVLDFKFINVVLESSIVTEDRYNQLADEILPVMEMYLRGNHPALYLGQLASWGWTGAIEQSTKDFYLKQYAKLYPTKGPDEHIHILARYFTGGLVRRNLGLYGFDASWNNMFLELSFHGMTPGLPKHRAQRRIHYRTIPCGITKQHNAPWRVKGYLLINKDSEALPKLCCFSDSSKEFNPFEITLTNGVKLVQLQADYIVEA